VRRPTRQLALAAALLTLTGCAFITWLGVQRYYDEVPLPDSQVERGIVYDPEHALALDLFVPAGPDGWPLVMFAYGGGWTSGSRDFVAGGADVYQNIGRFLASRGAGAAIIDYRLQPAATWRDQVRDVTLAAAWLHAHVREYGGDPARLIFAGHSAGAQLVTFAALERSGLAAIGVPAEVPCGIAAVSGAGMQLDDELTYAAGASRPYFEIRFRPGSRGVDWQREASALEYLRPGAPRLLAVYTDGDPGGIVRQMHLLHDRFVEVGARAEIIEVPGEIHASMVLALSRPGDPVSESVLALAHSCGR
jgi:acetyl esterase/lipase